MWEYVKKLFGFCDEELFEKKFSCESKINKIEETSKKQGSCSKKVKKHWYNNGKKHKLIPEGTKPPKGFVKGRIQRKKEAKCNKKQ